MPSNSDSIINFKLKSFRIGLNFFSQSRIISINRFFINRIKKKKKLNINLNKSNKNNKNFHTGRKMLEFFDLSDKKKDI